MKRTVSGVAFIVAVVVGCCLFSTSPAVALGCEPVHRSCPAGFAKGATGTEDVAKDINNDGSVCRFLFVVIDNNVPSHPPFFVCPIRR